MRLTPQQELLLRKEVPGMAARVHPRGHLVVEIDWWADPKRDQAWADQMRRRMPSLSDWRREYERDWTTSAGTAYYPEVAQAPEKYIVQFSGHLLDSPVYRCWDFGGRRPACVFFQYSPQQDRLWVLREIGPPAAEGLSTLDLRDLVRYVSGQITLDDLAIRPRALRVAQSGRLAPARLPWFTHGVEFVDYSGHEALQGHSNVDLDSEDVTHQKILAQAGVILHARHTGQGAREQVIRRLLRKVTDDGLGGLLIDPSCVMMARAFTGGIVYPKPTATNPYPRDPKKDGLYDHYHEAFGYGVTNVVPATEAEARRVAMAPTPSGRGVYFRQRRPDIDARGYAPNEVSDPVWNDL